MIRINKLLMFSLQNGNITDEIKINYTVPMQETLNPNWTWSSKHQHKNKIEINVEYISATWSYYQQ